MIGCVSGRDAVLAQNSSVTLNSSYFDPPYMVNNGDNLYNISYKTVAVTASHYDGTLVRCRGSLLPVLAYPETPRKWLLLDSHLGGCLGYFVDASSVCTGKSRQRGLMTACTCPVVPRAFQESDASLQGASGSHCLVRGTVQVPPGADMLTMCHAAGLQCAQPVRHDRDDCHREHPAGAAQQAPVHPHQVRARLGFPAAYGFCPPRHACHARVAKVGHVLPACPPLLAACLQSFVSGANVHQLLRTFSVSAEKI